MKARPRRPYTCSSDFLRSGTSVEDVLLALPVPVPIDVARAACFAANSHTRLGVVLLLAERMRWDLWLRLLGEMWTSFDTVCRHLDDLFWWIGDSRGTSPEMMTKDERAALAALPELVTIYRGCGSVNKNGICWSLDRAVAARFPTLNRYRVPDPMLLTATVPRDLIVALKLDREEQEVITFDAQVVSEESLVERLAA